VRAVIAMVVVMVAKIARGIDMRTNSGGPSRYSGLAMLLILNWRERDMIAILRGRHIFKEGWRLGLTACESWRLMHAKTVGDGAFPRPV
jgi:hypothetical protein